jgi:hypothetical protein
MADYILVIKGGMLDYSDAAQAAAHMQLWVAYNDVFNAHGTTIKSGAPVQFSGNIVGAKGTQPASLAAADTITGYYHIEAPNLATANAVAAKAPNIPLGGTVEVRPALVI